MTDIKEQLRQLGLEPGKWAATAEGSRLPPIIHKQKALLETVVDAFQEQINRDRAQIAQLQETVERLKHGGGA